MEKAKTTYFLHFVSSEEKDYYRVVLTATRTAGAAAVSKEKFHETKNDVFCLQRSVLNPETFKVEKLDNIHK